MVKISNASYENEIHREDIALLTRIPKYNFLTREALISGEGRLENLGKMTKNRETYCYAN